jgi:hypothetical protein
MCVCVAYTFEVRLAQASHPGCGDDTGGACMAEIVGLAFTAMLLLSVIDVPFMLSLV